MNPFPSGLAAALAVVTAHAAPVITDGPEFSPETLFVGETARFTVEARDGAGLALTYRWRFGDSTPAGPYVAEKDTVHRYGAPGHYRASIYVRNSAGEFVNAFLPVTVHTRPTPVRPSASSSIVLDTSRGRVWCVNPDHGSVSALDARALSLLHEIPTGASPQTLALGPGGTLWVANRASATVSILSAADGRVLGTLALPYGSAPHGIVFNPSGREAYLTLQGAGKLLRLDPVARKVSGEVVLGPTPRALAVSGDGRRILITRFISPAAHAEVWEVSATDFSKLRTFNLAVDRSTDTETSGGGVLNYLSAIVISPDGRRAVVPAVKANTIRGARVSGVPLIAENTVRAAQAFLDLEGNVEDPEDRNDFDNSALPSAAVFSPLGDLLFTALEGSNAVHTRDPHNNGAVLERNKAVGAAPLGLALDARTRTLYVHAFLGRSVSAWDVGVYDDPEAIERDSVASRPLGTGTTVSWEALPGPVLHGKRLFYDAANPAMSFNGYVSCAACHLDGGTDGRVWDFTDRGEGLRRTTSLLGRAGMAHGPVHWSANFDEIQDFENDIRGPFGGTGLLADAHFQAGSRGTTLGDRKAGLSADLDALAAYVSSLARVDPSPWRNPDGTLTPDALAGEAIFNSPQAGCARCHVPPLYTDSRLPAAAAGTRGGQSGGLAAQGSGSTGPTSGAGAQGGGTADAAIPGSGASDGPVDFLTPEGFLVHDVGTLRASSGRRLGDTLRGIDTPTLKGIWETGPYLHDGSAATLEDVIGTRNAGDRHGRTSHLDAREKAQLVAFLQQLDDGPAAPVALRDGPRPSLSSDALRWTGNRIRLPAAWRGAVLTLHDLQGRPVTTLGGGRPGPEGLWEWAWNGRTASGAAAKPGVYPVRVRGRDGAPGPSLALTWMP